MIYTQVVPASHLTPACHPPCPPRSWPFPRTTQWPWAYPARDSNPQPPHPRAWCSTSTASSGVLFGQLTSTVEPSQDQTIHLVTPGGRPRGLPHGPGESVWQSTGLVGKLAEPRRQTLLLPRAGPRLAVTRSEQGGARVVLAPRQGSCDSDAGLRQPTQPFRALAGGFREGRQPSRGRPRHKMAGAV